MQDLRKEKEALFFISCFLTWSEIQPWLSIDKTKNGEIAHKDINGTSAPEEQCLRNRNCKDLKLFGDFLCRDRWDTGVHSNAIWTKFCKISEKFLSHMIHQGCLCSRHFPTLFHSQCFFYISIVDVKLYMAFETRGLYVSVNIKPSYPCNIVIFTQNVNFLVWHLFHRNQKYFLSNILHISPFKCVCHCKTSGRELCKSPSIWHVQIWMFRELTFFTTKTAGSVWRLLILWGGVWF